MFQNLLKIQSKTLDIFLKKFLKKKTEQMHTFLKEPLKAFLEKSPVEEFLEEYLEVFRWHPRKNPVRNFERSCGRIHGETPWDTVYGIFEIIYILRNWRKILMKSSKTIFKITSWIFNEITQEKPQFFFSWILLKNLTGIVKNMLLGIPWVFS